MTRRAGGKRFRRIVAAGIVLLAGWVLATAVVAENRHQLPPPTRSAPDSGGGAFDHGFTPADLHTLLQVGRPDGLLPNGNRVTLSLNEELQAQIFDLFRRFDPLYGVFAAMEPDTGRVVALVGYRRGGESDPWLSLKAIYPAASLIKVVTASAAIERGKVSPQDEISYRGGIYGITRGGIHARDGRGIPKMTLEEAIARSANAVFGNVAVNHVGGPVLKEYLAKFGFGQRIPFDLPVETSRAQVPREEYELARTGAGFGEVYVSPLHMAMIMSAIASGGAMPRPVLIDRIEDRDGKPLYESSPVKWRDTVLPETANAVVRMMVKTVEMGTSHRTFGSPERTPLLHDMDVAAKTGSLSGWTPSVHFDWFAGVAPVGSPRLALSALVVNDSRWKIKGSYVGKEAFNSYFGYPSSLPPVYAKARGTRKWTRPVRAVKKVQPTVKVKGKKGKKAVRSRKRAPAKTAEKGVGKPLAVNSSTARAGG
ncbi:penicillin-binding transpeptidase domain-containing protein [Candidatus Deferrimicrobium sp.]|uniref:penicillin-binding transpeptidase domain-containing protein n=1 Tax=Candidatus Deferrimicrobium sp. TaxID=3060586 RepID=UPI0027160F23|nr:penicillin-binding transpeptidase domain-containing protein [Candidatus Deferrimicrobium sp.]MDO8738349.1 penicillin-binding transpeptidase domain-containing protein [Candidatus Deferrimicrobium sp.]